MEKKRSAVTRDFVIKLDREKSHIKLGERQILVTSPYYNGTLLLLFILSEAIHTILHANQRLPDDNPRT